MGQDQRLEESFFARIKQAARIVLTTHTSPDPDGLGAEIALSRLLLDMGYDCAILNHDKTPERYDFFTKDREILTVEEGAEVEQFAGALIISIDNSEVRRIGDLNKILEVDQSNLIILDHHDGSESDYLQRFQDPDCGSSCELVARLYRFAKKPFSKDTATALYAGIISDTGHFRFSKTGPETHRIAADLIESGARPEYVAEMLYNSSPVERLEARAHLYESLSFNKDRTIAYASLHHENIEDLGLNFGLLGGVINEFLEPAQIKAAVIFSQKEEDITRISIRTKAKYNALSAANQFGGGGHKNACGCAIAAQLDKAIEEFIPVLERALTENAV